MTAGAFGSMTIDNKSVTAILERLYRESPPDQHLRELIKNALEASSTYIHIGIEWQAVRLFNVYRQLFGDNGVGMNAIQLTSYLGKYGFGAKPIGNEHENFGVGVKTTVFPFNKEGVVVISSHRENEEAIPIARMAKFCYDEASGTYGMHPFSHVETDQVEEGELQQIVSPFKDREGIDWREISPPEGETGTVFVLLGNTGREDTILGRGDDHSRKTNYWITKYINRRFYEFPEGVEIETEEIQCPKRDDWPVERDRNGDWGQLRRPKGARHHLEQGDPGNPIKGEGIVSSSDGTDIRWILRTTDTQATDHRISGFSRGYIAIQYDNELYEIHDGQGSAQAYKGFGILGGSLSRRLSIIIKPSLSTSVFPDSSRRTLLSRANSDRSLPWDSWYTLFRKTFPEILKEEQLLIGSGLDNSRWQESFIETWGEKLQGDKSMIGGRGDRPRPGDDTHTYPPTREPAGNPGPSRASIPPMFPETRWVGKEVMGEYDKYPANYIGPSEIYPTGILHLNADFVVFKEHQEIYLNLYIGQPELHEQIIGILRGSYARTIIASIIHAPRLSRLGWNLFTREGVRIFLEKPDSLLLLSMGFFNVDSLAQRELKKLPKPIELGEEQAGLPSTEEPQREE